MLGPDYPGFPTSKGDNFLASDAISQSQPRQGVLPPDQAAASAIRSAAELREHVDGVRPFDSVLLWQNDFVRCYSVDSPEDDDNIDDPYSRFNQLYSYEQDHELISVDRALEMAKHDTCVVVNDVDPLLEIKYVDMSPAVAASRALPIGPRLLATHIELCCEDDSRLSDDAEGQVEHFVSA